MEPKKRERTACAAFRVIRLLAGAVLALGLGCAGKGADLALLQRIESSAEPNRAQVTIRLAHRVAFKTGRLLNPDRVYIDLEQASPRKGLTPPTLLADDSFIRGIWIERRKQGTTRVVVELKVPAEYSAVSLRNPSRVLLILRRTSAPPFTQQVQLPAVPALPSPPDVPASTVAPSLSELPAFPLPIAPAPPLVNPASRRPPDVARPAEPHPAPPSSRSVTIPHVARPPTLDDFLKGARAEAGVMITGFQQREPGDGKPVSQPTTAYLSYDDHNLYVIFVCQQNSASLRGHLSKRDDIGNDDQVSLYLDPFRDRQRAYVFSVNPLGVQADGVLSEGQTSPDYTFDTLWYSEGRLTPDGYVVWMSIPFKSVRFPNAAVQSWSIALERSIPQNSENSFWPFITRQTSGFAQQMAEADGLENISTGRNIQLIPYAEFTRASTLPSGEPPLETANVGRVGTDIKAVLGDAITLDATVNPDFSQVESDDPQVTVNQRYRVYFPEKRPFFLDNASYFQTPINLFFTRNIADPEFGARLTGTIDHWALGVMASDDRAPGEGLPSGDPLAGDRAADGVVTLRRQFSNQSTVGFLATTENFGSSSNQVISFDMRLRLSSTWFFTGQWANSFDRQPGGQRTVGQAAVADLSRSARHFSYDGSFSDFSPDFKAPLGFIQRVDIYKTTQYAAYLWRQESGLVADVGPFVGASADWDHLGTLQDWNAYAGFLADLKGSSGLKFTRYQIFERYLNQGFHYDKDEIYFYTGWLRWLYMYGTLDQGSGVNYQPGGSLAPFVGNTIDSNFGMTVRLSPRMRLDELYYYDRLKPSAMPVVYTDHFWRTKLNYQFTRALSLRAIVDYNAVLPNTALFQESRSKQLTGDILLTYLLNPGTALYIGYNNEHQNLATDPNAPPSLIPFGPPNYLTNSQIFVKLSYQLRF